MVIAAGEEALTAVEIHNSPLSPRPLEGFLVHMHIAWLYLLHAGFEKDKIDYRYRLKNGRYDRIDGEPKTWDLAKCTRERWPNSNDPTRANLELTVALRNKVEHRYERGLQVAAYGFTQALTINLESELVTRFGTQYSIADRVHLPVSLSTFSREGAVALAKAQTRLPKRLRDFFIDYRAGLSEEVRTDRSFEFRVEIMQKRAPKSDADLAVSFVRIEDLTPEELGAYENLEKTGRVILREKEGPKGGWMRPGAASKEIQDRLGWRFHPSAEFPRAWQFYKARPPSSATGEDRRRTDSRYCKWDPTFEQYVYSGAFVEKVVEDCSTEDHFEKIVGWPPKPIPDVK